MALEPMLPSDEPSHELTDFTRRMWISAAAAVPLVILTMGGLAVLQTRSGFDREPVPQHVDIDQPRCGSGLSLLDRRHLPARDFPGTVQDGPRRRHLYRGGDAIRALLDLAPKTARRILPDGSKYDAPRENIMEGDRLRVRPGDSVPVDGVVIEAGEVGFGLVAHRAAMAAALVHLFRHRALNALPADTA